MRTIKEILGLHPKPDDWDRRPPSRVEVTAPIAKVRKLTSLAYEDEVFTFLFEHRKELGIERIYRLKNQRMDGELELPGGDLVAIEIKFRMNWLKACQSGYQFRRYLAINAARKGPTKAGIVFFKEFSGDWQKRWKARPIELGWVAWYLTHHQVNDLPFHLVRLAEGQLETYSEPANPARRVGQDPA
jgi:hypothetical protein